MNIRVDPPASGAENMLRDSQLFDKLEKEKDGSIYLRFYSWSEPTISIGNTQKNIKFSEEWPVVLRPTGGGVVFHQPGDLTYALVCPLNILPRGVIPSCKAISKIFVEGFKKLGIKACLAARRGSTQRQMYCFDRPAKYEIMVDGKKLMGSAQKRGKYALLQQGTIQRGIVELPAYQILADIFIPEFRRFFLALKEEQ